MSIINAIANCKRPFNSGVDKIVFYSKKHDTIIKMARKNFYYGDSTNDQIDRELEIFNRMTEQDKEIFPVIDILDYNGKMVILMKKCKVIGEDKNIYWRVRNYINRFDDTNLHTVNLVSDLLGLDKSYNKTLMNFIKTFNIGDLHLSNIGIYNNHFVIIDAGI